MNSIKKLKENVTSFLTEIANHYGLSMPLIEASLEGINFDSLYHSLYFKSMPVYSFRACGSIARQHPFIGGPLFPCHAIILYRHASFAVNEPNIGVYRFLEVWLREDLTFAITVCYHVDNKKEGYRTSYRIYQGAQWPFEEATFDFNAFFTSLFEVAPGIAEGQPLFEP